MTHKRDVTAQEDAALNAALRSSTVKVEHPEIARLRAELSAVKSELRDVTIAVDDERVNNTMTLAQCVAEAVAQNEALLEKLDALAPTGTCACSYDASGDVCMRHSPEVMRLRAELAECKRDAERYRTALEQIVAPFEDLNFVSGNKPLTYLYYVATDALAAKGSEWSTQ